MTVVNMANEMKMNPAVAAAAAKAEGGRIISTDGESDKAEAEEKKKSDEITVEKVKVSADTRSLVKKEAAAAAEAWSAEKKREDKSSDAEENFFGGGTIGPVMM